MYLSLPSVLELVIIHVQGKGDKNKGGIDWQIGKRGVAKLILFRNSGGH